MIHILEKLRNKQTLFKLTENEILEFKECKEKLSSSFWETYSAFSNTDGGIIVLGIKDNHNGGVGEIVGVSNPSAMKQEIFNTANSKDKVSYNSFENDDIEIVEVETNSYIIIVKVKKVDIQYRPVYLNKNIQRAYTRRGEADQLLTEVAIKSYIISSTHNLDAELLPETYTIDDLNRDSIIRYRELIQDDISSFSDDNEQFLLSLGVLRKDRKDHNKIKLTKGGLLFFGHYNSILDCIPHFHLDYFEIDRNSEARWEDRVSTGDMQYPDLNIFDFYRIVYDKLTSTLKSKFLLDEKGELRIDYKHNLRIAIREALVNSLMHAQYDIDFPVKITSYKEHIEFCNPGIISISLEEFSNGGTSHVINDVISRLCRRIGISEKAGSGGKRIFDVAEKLNLKTPEIVISKMKGYTKIRIWKNDFISLDSLTDLEKKLIEYLTQNISASKTEICNTLNISDYYSRKLLDTLEKNNYIFKAGSGRATRYMLSKGRPIGRTAYIRNLIKILDEE